MNTVAEVRRFDLVHVRVLEQLLAHGQVNSCTALMHLGSGAVLSRGKGSEAHKPIDERLLAAMGQSVFAAERASEAASDLVRELCTRLGGVTAVSIMMRESGLFLVRLPDSSRILSLVVRHRETTASASETVVHGRAIRSRVAAQKMQDIEAEVQQEVARSYSIWQALIKAITSRLSGPAAVAAPTPAPAKAMTLDLLRQAVAHDEQVAAADLFDLKTGAHLDHYRHPSLALTSKPDVRATIAALADVFGGRLDVRSILRHFGFADTLYGKVQIQIGDRDFYWLRVPFFPAMHIPFDTESALLLYKAPRPSPALDWTALDHAGLDLLRLRIGALLVGGMKTEMYPFPETQIEFQAIVNRIAALPKDDLIGRLDIGGFAAHAVVIDDVNQRCQECIYYLPHRKWCDLPELPVPVEATWWCRLWKI